MKTIPVALPELGEREIQSAAATIMSGWVTQGPRVAEFERTFGDYVGADHACAVTNCTVAIQLALQAVGVKPGDTVITVSHSFIATANAVRHCRAEPVFVDIDPATLNMDLNELERIISEDFTVNEQGFYYRDIDRLSQGESPLVAVPGRRGRLGAVLAVHQAGMPMDMERLLNITKPLGVPVVEDAACAAGSEIYLGNKWERIGNPHGEIACFSFHPRKVITTGDGGMLTTSNLNYDSLFRLLRQHGMSVSDAERHGAKEIVFENYQLTGYNARMTDIQASIGTEQVGRLGEIVERRRRIATAYFTGLGDLPNVRLINEPSYARSNWQSFLIFIEDASRQKNVMQELLKQGISTRRGIMCAHLEKPYAAAWQREHLKESEKARDTGIVLPLYASMNDEQIAKVVAAVQCVMEAERPR